MYSIVGADDKEYGPVEKDTLVQWARDGRVIERTSIIDHATGRRYLACDMEELSVVFSNELVVAPPALHPARRARTSPPVQVVLPPDMLVDYRPRRSRIVAGLLGIFLGAFGVHRFYLGHTAVGTIMLCITIFTCFVGGILTSIWGLVEGILCLVGGMTDAEGRKLGV